MKREVFYDGNWQSSLYSKARIKSMEVNSRTYRWANEGSKVCQMCVGGVDEIVDHLMLVCPRYEEIREQLGKWSHRF